MGNKLTTMYKSQPSITKEDVLTQLLSTLDGRKQLAAAMVQPLRCGGKDYPSYGILQDDIDICMCGCGRKSTIFRKSNKSGTEYVSSYCMLCWVKNMKSYLHTRSISREEAMVYAVMWE
jgi:hypothetical protein